MRHSISRIPSRRQPGGANGFSGSRDAALLIGNRFAPRCRHVTPITSYGRITAMLTCDLEVRPPALNPRFAAIHRERRLNAHAIASSGLISTLSKRSTRQPAVPPRCLRVRRVMTVTRNMFDTRATHQIFFNRSKCVPRGSLSLSGRSPTRFRCQEMTGCGEVDKMRQAVYGLIS